MKSAVFAIILLPIASINGCATSTSNPGAEAASNSDSCISELTRTAVGAGSSNPGVAHVIFATFFDLGLNFAFYGICEGVHNDAHLKSLPAVSDGVYHSKDKLFSVTLPEQLAENDKPGISIRESDTPERDVVFFVPSMGSGSVYGISVTPVLSSDDESLSLKKYADSLFTGELRQFLESSGTHLKHLYDESVTLDGKAAIFEIYGPDGNDLSEVRQADSTGQAISPYLLYYVVKSSSGMSAVLSITWHGDCPKCSSGPEADIRNMDPRIATFVNSFKLMDRGSNHE